MSAIAAWPSRGARVATDADARPVRIALLGTGTVGRALLARLASWQGATDLAPLELVYAANSRQAVADPLGLCARKVSQRLGRAGSAASTSPAGDVAKVPIDELPSALNRVEEALDVEGTRIVIDATASADVTAHHARWLARGVHVVTACKLGQGSGHAQWHAIHAAAAAGDALYGDSATVGAGLPLLRTLRELRAGGDRIHAIAGVLSGSLAWLFNHYDGLRPFSGFVREARRAGYTEPDPRDDLSGEDVRRKLLILARTAGAVVEPGSIEVESLVPPPLAGATPADVDAGLDALDAPLRERFARAYRSGEKLRFIARFDLATGQAKVGLASLPPQHALASGAGTDNRVAIWSDRYAEQPLVIQGPGAGAGVTAAALLDDALRIARSRLR